MSFNKKTWKARQGVGLNKFSDGNGNMLVLTNTPDSITEVGDSFSADNMNDLETRIANGIADGANIQTSTATINDLTVNITYIKSGSRAIVYIADMVQTGTGGSTITLPAELQGYTYLSGRTAGGYGGGTVWQTGNPKNIYLIANDTNGKTISIMGQGAMPVTVSNYTIIEAWCVLNYSV
ncbi:MAG: hypothetical protein KH354_05635 [Clostridiales bacterium]|nr:hypothetical protein [Clostridiales bacterium]